LFACLWTLFKDFLYIGWTLRTVYVLGNKEKLNEWRADNEYVTMIEILALSFPSMSGIQETIYEYGDTLTPI
jgi:hypothetical protein